MHEVLVNRLGGLSLPRKSVVRLTDRPNMTLDVYRGRKTTTSYVMYSLLSRALQAKVMKRNTIKILKLGTFEMITVIVLKVEYRKVPKYWDTQK